MRCRSAVLVLVFFTACATKHAPTTAPGVEQTDQLARADADLAAGCLDCLTAAFRGYETIRTSATASDSTVTAALAGSVRSAALIAIRERELGLVDTGHLQKARALISEAGSRPGWCDDVIQGCSSIARIVQAIDILPIGTRFNGPPTDDAGLERFRRLNRDRADWRQFLRGAAGSNLLNACVWMIFACDADRPASVEQVMEPITDRAMVPLVAFKRATCLGTDRDALEALLTRDARFMEVTYELGLFAVGQRKLDDAERAFERALSWRPVWPALTLSIGNVAMTAADFERALDFYDRTLNVQPGSTNALLGKLRASTYLAHHDDAIAIADLLLTERWHLGEARYWRALNEAQLGRHDEAWLDIEEAAKLMVNAEVPKLAGIIAAGRRQTDVARAKFEESHSRNSSDCETSYYLGLILAEQSAWPRVVATFTETASCLEQAEREGLEEIARIRVSDAPPERRQRYIARREQAIVRNRRMLATSWFNTAVASYNLGRAADARTFADRIVDDEQFGERARELISRLKN